MGEVFRDETGFEEEPPFHVVDLSEDPRGPDRTNNRVAVRASSLAMCRLMADCEVRNSFAAREKLPRRAAVSNAMRVLADGIGVRGRPTMGALACELHNDVDRSQRIALWPVSHFAERRSRDRHERLNDRRTRRRVCARDRWRPFGPVSGHAVRQLVDWLDYNGYTLVTKRAKEFVDPTGRRKVRGDMDIEIAVVCALNLAAAGRHAISLPMRAEPARGVPVSFVSDDVRDASRHNGDRDGLEGRTREKYCRPLWARRFRVWEGWAFSIEVCPIIAATGGSQVNAGSWKTDLPLILATGLLALVVICCDASPALAQTREACPLPAGATPVAPPRVTAQQVENGTGSLMDFALIARERSREHAQPGTSAGQGAYIACLVRQEDGPWRSGSTYLVSLTLDGRVFLHAKDMALSGGRLNPLIYAEILSSLGVSPADLANMASPDPDTRNGAVRAVIATLSREPDAPFDATAPIPGVRLGIPGASGYASVYVSSELGSPIVLLAGFDLDASHLASEAIDYGDPAITARDVVDRETLKAFVTQAGEYFLELQKTGDPAAASKARIALRDPNGPWRHGSVYLYVLDTVSNVISFHAAFPDRFEYKPLVPTVRDAVTGEFVLPQVIAAARSGPEGGFLEYFWDDPSDDSDSADVPKVGYAREFTGQLTLPGGGVLPISFIVGSGFYGSGQEAESTSRNAVVDTVLPQVMRAMTAGTVDAISGPCPAGRRPRRPKGRRSPAWRPRREPAPQCRHTHGTPGA